MAGKRPPEGTAHFFFSALQQEPPLQQEEEAASFRKNAVISPKVSSLNVTGPC
jgi:hypothetical protein